MTKVIILDPSIPVTERFEVRTIDTELKSMQEIVDGYIEMIELKIGNIYYDFVLNEEGKIHSLPPNIAIIVDDELLDIIMGTVIITKYNDDGEMVSLTDYDILQIKEYFINLPKRLGRLTTLNTGAPVLLYNGAENN